MSQLVTRAAVTISAGAAGSTTINTNGLVPTVLEMPAAWTASHITFGGSGDGTNLFFIYKEDGTLLDIPTDAARRIILPTTYLKYHKLIQVVSGLPGALNLQAADRIIYIEMWE
jgi:hypothetical protein